VADLGVFVDGEAGGEEDGDGDDKAWERLLEL